MRARWILVGLVLSLSLLPAAVGAELDFSKTVLPFTDVDPTSDAALPISLLAAEGVLQGYPDGSMRPGELVNRAEFVKIALLSHPEVDLENVRPDRCFPDVPRAAWFSGVVCLGKTLGLVRGYPDPAKPEQSWLFHPTRPVNYVEAIAILARLYQYSLTVDPRDEWYTPYLRAANVHGTALVQEPSPSTFLTRGQVATLAAQFLTEEAGQLSVYRAVERGERPPDAPAPSPGGTSSPSPVPEAIGDVPAAPQPPLALLPEGFFVIERSRFLLLGASTPPVAGVTVFSEDEPQILRGIDVIFQSPPNSIGSVPVYLGDGVFLGPATLNRTLSSLDDAFSLSIPSSNAPTIPQGQNVRVVVALQMRDPDDNGQPGETIEVKELRLTTVGGYTNATRTVSNTTLVHPKHQATMTRLGTVVSAGPTEDVFHHGTQVSLGSFAFRVRDSLPEASPALEHLSFILTKTSNLSVSRFFLAANDTLLRHECAVSDQTISCLSLPAEIGSLPTLQAGGGAAARTLTLHGDVSIVAPGPVSLQLRLGDPGNPAAVGSVRWTDGTGHFSWIEQDSPVAEGTVWK